MERQIVYHNRHITSKDIEYIKSLITGNPNKSRWYLSRELCRQWNWRQRNGSIKDMVCRGLLLKLEREGLITLTPVKRIPIIPYWTGGHLGMWRLIRHLLSRRLRVWSP